MCMNNDFLLTDMKAQALNKNNTLTTLKVKEKNLKVTPLGF